MFTGIGGRSVAYKTNSQSGGNIENSLEYDRPLFQNIGDIALNRVHDDSVRKEMSDELSLQKVYFQQLFENCPEAIAMLDGEDRVVNINKGFEKLFQYTIQETKGRHINGLIVPDFLLDEATVRSRDVLEGGISKGESIRVRKDGALVDVLLLGYPIIVDDSLVGIFAIYSDISRRKAAERALKESEERYRYLSFHDSLTEAYNRAFLEEELKRLDADEYLPLSIIMGDVNGLKLVNDVFGHKEGDKILVSMAEILKECCRYGDIVARWGGDEFVVLLPKLDEMAANNICEEIKSKFKLLEDNPIHPSIALGVAAKEKSSQDIQSILNEAENRMYRNKMMEDKSSRHSIIVSLEHSLLEADYETEEHAKRLQKLTEQMGKFLNLTDNKMNELALLAVLHDIGKIGISREILMKPAPLSDDEWLTIKKHPEIGYRIAKSIPELSIIAEAILAHHERWDGKGYPRGLMGEEIPFISRMVSIADAYDVMTSGRPYRKPLSREAAFKELETCAGSYFDPYLVGIFIGMFEETI